MSVGLTNCGANIFRPSVNFTGAGYLFALFVNDIFKNYIHGIYTVLGIISNLDMM